MSKVNAAGLSKRLEALEHRKLAGAMPESVGTAIQQDNETNQEFDERIAAIRSTGKRVIQLYVIDGSLPES